MDEIVGFPNSYFFFSSPPYSCCRSCPLHNRYRLHMGDVDKVPQRGAPKVNVAPTHIEYYSSFVPYFGPHSLPLTGGSIVDPCMMSVRSFFKNERGPPTGYCATG